MGGSMSFKPSKIASLASESASRSDLRFNLSWLDGTERYTKAKFIHVLLAPALGKQIYRSLVDRSSALIS
jgi:hypothetical protein